MEVEVLGEVRDLERGLPEGLRRTPRGAHAQELVPLPVVATEPERAGVTG